MSNSTLTKEIAGYVLENHLNAFSNEDYEMMKIAITDWVSVALCGSNEESVRMLLSVMKTQTESGTSTLIGQSCKTSSLWATLINGTASHSQDFDDIHDFLSMHLTVPICSAAFSAAESVHASGAEFINAVSNAMQLMVGIAAAIMPEHYQNFWHATATIGIFGATAACANLLKLTPNQLCQAFGIAASKASGTQIHFGSMNKPMQPAQAARNGYESALLAKEGFTSCDNIFESNYFSIMSGRVEVEKILPRMRGPLAVHELRYKRFPCGAPTHSGILNSLAICKEHNVTPDQIERIVLEPYPRAIRLAGTPHPATGLAEKFSLPFCTAAAIVTGHITIDTFSEEVLNLPQVQHLLNIIELVPNDTYTPSRGGKATFYMKDGNVYSHEEYLLGKSVDPAVLKQNVYEKYMEIAPGIINKNAEAVWNLLQSLEKVTDIQEVLNLLSL